MAGSVRRLMAALGVSLVLGACGTEAASTPDAYPPNDRDALAEIYADRLTRIGVRLTRGALIDLDDDYEPSDTGTHLALYVEPVDESSYPTGRYVENIVSVARVFATDVFGRWNRLESFDVCQEPPASVDDRDVPEAVTQVTFTRATAAAADWETIDLAGLVELRLDAVPDFNLTVSFELSKHPRYRAAVREARQRGTGPA